MTKQGGMTHDDAPQADAPEIVFTMPSLRDDAEYDVESDEPNVGTARDVTDESVGTDESVVAAAEYVTTTATDPVVDELDQAIDGDRAPDSDLVRADVDSDSDIEGDLDSDIGGDLDSDIDSEVNVEVNVDHDAPFEHDTPVEADAQVEHDAPVEADDVTAEPDAIDPSPNRSPMPASTTDQPADAPAPGSPFAPPTPDTRAEYMYALIEAERARILEAQEASGGLLDRLRKRKK